MDKEKTRTCENPKNGVKSLRGLLMNNLLCCSTEHWYKASDDVMWSVYSCM